MQEYALLLGAESCFEFAPLRVGRWSQVECRHGESFWNFRSCLGVPDRRPRIDGTQRNMKPGAAETKPSAAQACLPLPRRMLAGVRMLAEALGPEGGAGRWFNS